MPRSTSDHQPQTAAGRPAPDGATDCRLAIVIISRNTRELLRRCLDAIATGTRTPYQLWVVDNASTDGSAELVRAGYPAARLIASGRNLGFATANNLALAALVRERAGAPLPDILLLNPDTEAPPGAIDAMLAHLDAHPEVGAVGVQLLNPDGTPQRSYDAFYSFVASLWRNKLVDTTLRRRRGIAPAGARAPFDVDWVIGACLLVRGAALAEVGPLDDRFFMYGEEVDLQWRLQHAGWRRQILPGVHVVHYGGQSSKQAHRRMMLEEYRSRWRLVRKHTAWPTRGPYVLKALLALAVWTVGWGARAGLGGGEAARERAAAYASVLRAHCTPGFYAVGIGRGRGRTQP